MEIVYRALKSPEEMERAVDLQKNYWGKMAYRLCLLTCSCLWRIMADKY